MTFWRQLVIGMAGALALAGAAEAGTVTGHVHAEGIAGADAGAAGGGAYESRAFKFAEKVDYAAMKDFVVSIEGPVGTNQAAAAKRPVQVETRKMVQQQKAVFTPHVLPVLVGTTVEWPNRDDIFHNVFSESEGNAFNLGLYKDPEVRSVTFDHVGRVDIFCSIHANMNCIILVLENPYFAVTDGRGNYALTNVPPGTYKLKAWHERLPGQVKEIHVADGGNLKVDFTLSPTLPRK